MTEDLLAEPKALLEAGLREAGEGIVARSDSLVAAHLLECSVSSLDHAHEEYATPLAQAHALHHLAERTSREGFEVSGYDEDGFQGFYLKVPPRRIPVIVGPDDRCEAFVEFHRSDGLVVRSEES